MHSELSVHAANSASEPLPPPPSVIMPPVVPPQPTAPRSASKQRRRCMVTTAVCKRVASPNLLIRRGIPGDSTSRFGGPGRHRRRLRRSRNGAKGAEFAGRDDGLTLALGSTHVALPHHHCGPLRG